MKLTMMPSMLVVAIAYLWSTCLAHPEVKPFDYEIIQLDNHGLPPLFSFGNSHGITTAKGCKVFPGDAEWPSGQAWALFNQTLNGTLIQTVPLAAPCYASWPEYNPAECEAITSAWNDSSLQYDPIDLFETGR